MGCHLLSGVADLEFVDQSPGGGPTTTTTHSGGHGGALPTGGTGGAAGSGGSAQAGAEPCHPLGLEDGFDNGSYDGSLWSLWGGAPTGVENGRWFVAPTPSAVDGETGILYSQSYYDHHDCSAWIEVPTVFDVSISGEASFYLWGDDSNRVKIDAHAGTIGFKFTVNGADDPTAELTYDPVEHRWWRIRESAGTVHLETSPDAHTWTDRLSAASPAYVGNATMEFGAASWGTMPMVSRVEFDNVDLLP